MSFSFVLAFFLAFFAVVVPQAAAVWMGRQDAARRGAARRGQARRLMRIWATKFALIILCMAAAARGLAAVDSLAPALFVGGAAAGVIANLVLASRIQTAAVALTESATAAGATTKASSVAKKLANLNATSRRGLNATSRGGLNAMSRRGNSRWRV